MEICTCCPPRKPCSSARKPNYQKLVDPYVQKYINFVDNRKAERNVPCAIMAIDRAGKKFAIPYPCEKFTKNADQQGSSRKGACAFKVTCEEKQCPPPSCKKYLCCRAEPACPVECEEPKKLVPCVADTDNYKTAPVANVHLHMVADKSRRQMPKPRDYAYRCESRELLASKLMTYCLCVRRNGLQDDCPRTPCLGRPACLVKPWPDCWPSGGCHGQDYDRPNGVERVNPTLQYRRDDPNCGPNKEAPQMMMIINPC